MKNIIIITLSAIVTVQCQYQTMPYTRPGPCGIPGIQQTPALPTILPARQPSVNTLPISLPMSSITPPSATSFPVSLLNSLYETSLPKTPMMTTPFELPISLTAPSKTLKPSPYEFALPITLPKTCGCLEAPVPKLDSFPRSPFLPAASPVSALAPFSPLLPPANTCSRCQYLKKIPIPPPCI